jgi:hypothetical protein
MTISADSAIRQASMTVHDYTMRAVTDLCDLLGIDRQAIDWHTELIPFASVLAAMITAAAADYDTAVRAGVVEDIGGARVDAEFAEWKQMHDGGVDAST